MSHVTLDGIDGNTWEQLLASELELNKNVEANFMPDPYPEFGQDAHYIALSPSMPDRIYQQNHCGIYRVDRPEEKWERIGNAMPKTHCPATTD